MSAHLASYVRERPIHRQPLRAGVPVPMLDWASDLFSEVHPLADADWIDSELRMHDGLPVPGHGLQYHHAGVAS